MNATPIGLINKFIRFFLLERAGLIRTAIIIILALILWQGNKIFLSQQKNLNELRRQKTLVDRIPEMQTRYELMNQGITLSQVSAPANAPAGKPQIPLILNAVVTKDGVLTAIISGGMFKVGDPINDYVIKEIAPDNVTLEHKETKETKKVYFSWKDKQIFSPEQKPQ